MSSSISRMLSKGILECCTPHPEQVISNVFPRMKSDDTARVILNLKQLNKSVEYFHFKMETLQTAIEMMVPGCWLASLDFKDAYYHELIFGLQRCVLS